MAWLLLLYFRLIMELLRYDLAQALLGFRGIHKNLPTRAFRQCANSQELEAAVSEALSRIVPFYWKRVQCLQRSVVTARVLCAYGARAEVVIGYRLAPFLAHAWVEVGGRVVNDSSAFQRRLQVLERISS
jgi:hypothetical protein